MKNFKLLIQSIMIVSILGLFQNTSAQRKMEALDRGVVAVQSGNDVYIGWRVLATELRQVTYNIYRDGGKVKHYTPLPELPTIWIHPAVPLQNILFQLLLMELNKILPMK